MFDLFNRGKRTKPSYNTRKGAENARDAAVRRSKKTKDFDDQKKKDFAILKRRNKK